MSVDFMQMIRDHRAEILAAIEARKAAKKAKNFAEADRIRDELATRGVTLIDTAQGTTYKIN